MRRRWLPAVLAGIRELAAQGKVRFTIKALRELAARVVSMKTGEWMYVFEPTVGETVVYVKVILRDDCVVISFHEEEDQSDEDE